MPKYTITKIVEAKSMKEAMKGEKGTITQISTKPEPSTKTVSGFYTQDDDAKS